MHFNSIRTIFPVFIICLIFIGCTSDVKEAHLTTSKKEVNKSSEAFISGIKSAQVYTKKQAVKGSEFKYEDNRKFTIQFYYEQHDVLFYTINENRQKKRISAHFEAGYSSDDSKTFELKENVNFLIGQYDFNADDIDELIIAVQDNDKSTDNGISINVFELKNDEWTLMGKMTGQTILGEPKATVKMNKITIPRNLRGFYYQWTLESGVFKDTGNY